MKKVIIMALCLALCLTMFAGCGSTETEATVAPSSTTSTTEPETFVFTMGLDDTFTPMGFRDDSNNIVGFDIDVATAVCDYLGWELVLQPIAWESKELELNAGTIDCIWNGMSWSEERAAAMTLSMPYMNNEMVFVVRSGEVSSVSDLYGKTVGVQSGSTADETLSSSDYASEISILSYDTNDIALFDLDFNGIDAVFMDSVSAGYYIATSGKDLEMLTEGSANEQYVIGFRKDDTELCAQIETALYALEADGTLETISIKWFSEDVIIFE
ncbi:MAG: amino acid ABC transporter substrate-binding protein [Bacillota bacterium]